MQFLVCSTIGKYVTQFLIISHSCQLCHTVVYYVTQSSILPYSVTKLLIFNTYAVVKYTATTVLFNSQECYAAVK